MSQQWQNWEHEQQFLDIQLGQFNQQVPHQHQPNPATSSFSNPWPNPSHYDGISPALQTVPSQFVGPTLHRVFHSLLGPSRDEACWRCRNSHTKCEPKTQTPCRRCADSKGNTEIACVRGDVCTLGDEVPFLCPLRAAADPLSHLSHLPQNLQPGASLLSQTKQHRRLDRSKYKGGPMPDPNHRLLWSVVNTTVPSINSFNPFQDLGFSLVVFPNHDLIMSIVWELELEDYPTVAERVGIGSIGHLVALLEAACLCETRYGHHEESKRLVFLSMKLLLYCLECLRLLDHGLLAANSHGYCTAAAGQGLAGCRVPGFQNLTKHGESYTDALTKALFDKKRDLDGRWLLLFYSLCIEAHVRRGFMAIEARLYNIEPAVCRTSNYLVHAITLFEQISLQKKRKLASKVASALAQVQPSMYLREANIDAGDINWENWHDGQENIPRYLRSIFAVPRHPLQRIHPLASGPPLDLNCGLEVPFAPPPQNLNIETATNFVATDPGSNVNMVPNGDPVLVAAGIMTAPVIQSHCVRGVPDPDPHREDEVASYYTRTSHAASSDSWTLNTMSSLESSASTVTVTNAHPPSMGSSTLHVPMNAHFAHGPGYDSSHISDHAALARSWEVSFLESNRGHFPSS